MLLNRCPSCHSRISLEQMAQDESTTQLLGLLIDNGDISKALVVYLGLFRSSKRDLASDRALRLATEVLALCEDKTKLETALTETVQSMRVKQDQGAFKPLSNHNYLKRVLETITVDTPAITAPAIPALNGAQMPIKGQSKSKQAIDMLSQFPSPEGVDEWFTRTVCGALAEMMIMGLEGVPAADTMHLVAERFINSMWEKREWKQKHHFTGAKRLRVAFIQTAESSHRWPTPKDVLADIPKMS